MFSCAGMFPYFLNTPVMVRRLTVRVSTCRERANVKTLALTKWFGIRFDALQYVQNNKRSIELVLHD